MRAVPFALILVLQAGMLFAGSEWLQGLIATGSSGEDVSQMESFGGDTQHMPVKVDRIEGSLNEVSEALRR